LFQNRTKVNEFQLSTLFLTPWLYLLRFTVVGWQSYM